MGHAKRKRESTDSAIADMSSDDSFSANSDVTGSAPSTRFTQFSPVESQSKRSRKSRAVASRGISIHDYGTAASQRPRRGTTVAVSPVRYVPQSPPPENTLRRKRSLGQADSAVSEADQPPDVVHDEKTRIREVNGNDAEREQTLERYEEPAELPTPRQTVEKTSIQATPQSPRRRSSRVRKPTERSQVSAEHSTPCRKPSNARPGRTAGTEGEDLLEVDKCKSRIVHLRVPQISSSQNTEHLMSFTGSFSHRLRSSENTQNSSEQSQCFVDNGSSYQQNSETFAQPRPEPILADSQDLDSSQHEPHHHAENHTAAHLQILRHNGAHGRGQVGTQQRQGPTVIMTSKTLPQRSDDPLQSSEIVQEIATVDNDSWQTQATVPLYPPWSERVDMMPGNHCHAVDTASIVEQGSTIAHTSFHASQATTIDEEPLYLPCPNQSPALNKSELREIADRLFLHRTYGSPKPEPVGQPPVWADGRMELCETLHYFRSYQGASHCSGGFARGFMFDKVAHTRDYIDSNVVIARAGGGQVKDKTTGEMKVSRDQVEDTTSNSLRNCIEHYNPVVIIVGVDNPHIQSQPPHQYCVLDYFKPTHIWTEKSSNSKIVRYRFEKLNTIQESWWRPQDIEDQVELGSLPPPFVKSCGTCARDSLQIYLNGWMCLQPTCGSFWLIFPSRAGSPRGDEPFEPDEASLVYDPRFLKSRTPWPNDDHEYPLTSSDATLSDHAVPGEDTSEAFIRGVVCPCCGRCNSRMDWTGWECHGTTCDWKKSPPHTLIPAISVREPLWPLSHSYTSSRDTHSSLVTVHVSFANNYRINRYTIPGISGFITHMIANKTVVEEPGGPDDMFEELQRADIGLRRRLIDNTQLKGGTYTRNFLVNYGMPYKFIAATASHPFSSAARPITATRSRLNWAANYLLSTEPSCSTPKNQLQDFSAHEFNEVLALGYFESQRISYHDDGESGLGPTISTLSLGAPGTMHLRLKAKHFLGVSSAGIYTDAPPLPGSTAYTTRLALQPALQTLKTTDPKAYRAKLREIPHDLGLKRSGNAKDVLKLEVAHGDIVVMHGADLQRYYEHAVEHRGKLRFALTCRYIDPMSLEEGERVEVQRDEGGYDGTSLQRGGGSAGQNTLE